MAHNEGLVEIALEDGQRIRVSALIADRVRGIDADGDVVVTLGTTEAPILNADGTDCLVPLTPCCDADGKGTAECSTGVECRACYREVDVKYGAPGRLAVKVAIRPSTSS